MDFMMYLKAFLVGGLLCVIGQILLDNTNITSARILVLFVTSGVVLTAIGLYGPVVEFAGAGATIPLTGFGYALYMGTVEAVKQKGLIGLFTGGASATAGGVVTAVVFGYLYSVIFKAKTKV
jgi:stage V sporulation protein AE